MSTVTESRTNPAPPAPPAPSRHRRLLTILAIAGALIAIAGLAIALATQSGNRQPSTVLAPTVTVTVSPASDSAGVIGCQPTRTVNFC